jgi:hypothetical protein
MALEHSDESVHHLFLLTMWLSEWAAKFLSLPDWMGKTRLDSSSFDSKYQMSYESFTKLVSILKPALKQNNNKSVNSCGELPFLLHTFLDWQFVGAVALAFMTFLMQVFFFVQQFFGCFGREFLH